MYIQVDEIKDRDKSKGLKMKLVKQKNQEDNSPKPRKIAANEAQISDVSDVEPAPNTGTNMLKFNIRFENLEDILERFSTQLLLQGSSISELQANQKYKTGNKLLSNYFDKISTGISSDVGQKSHKFKLNDDQFINEDVDNPDSVALKRSVESFIDKLDLLSASVIRLNKFKAQVLPRVGKLEECSKDYLTLLDFREEMEVLSKRIHLEV